jgi:hypothetical protein
MSLIVDGSKGLSFTSPIGVPGGRLTLQSGVPVMNTDAINVSTIYYTPNLGALIPIYDGSLFQMQTFSELSALASDTTKSPAALGNSKVNDWFVWADTGGILRLSHGPDWTSNNARSAGTALTRVGGILLNSASISNACAAQRGTYVGTTYSSNVGLFYMNFGGRAAGGSPMNLLVWNMYNRNTVSAMNKEDITSWGIEPGVIHMLGDSPNNRANAVFGLSEDQVSVRWIGSVAGAGSGMGCSVAPVLDSTSTLPTGTNASFPFNSTAEYNAYASEWAGFAPLGFHFWQMNCYAQGGGAVFFQPASHRDAGIFFTARM